MKIFNFDRKPASHDRISVEQEDDLLKRDPQIVELFVPEFYRHYYLDIARSGIDPEEHYFRHGIKENRRPSPAFDPIAYLQAYPDVARENIDPLAHFFRHGRKEGRFFRGPSYYTREQFSSARERILQSGLFDSAFYLAQNPQLREIPIDPVFHYLARGYSDCLEPSPILSMRAYLSENPDVRLNKLNPLLHYIEIGQAEGRRLPKSMQAKWVDSIGLSLPDDIVTLEINAGSSFFSRYGFSFESSEPAKHLGEAVRWLACQTPVLQIDHAKPKVSIVIPVYGQMPFILGCLDSLCSHNSKYPVEIIVYDDVSPEDSETKLLETLPWIRYVRAKTNGGFIEACNSAAEQVNGEYIVLLNSDTRVVPGWLDELIESFTLFPKAGMVGSKLLNADGTLQEAGAIVWNNGSPWNYGRGDDSNRPRYCFARRVDYCSGAAVAIPTALWRRVGGLDPIYKPAYCDDADLAFRLRSLGYETWFQPQARVVHYEGISHGRDLKKGVKAYQSVNLERMKERWRDEISSHGYDGELPYREANRLARRRMLVLDAGTPTPDRDSGSYITDKMLSAFQELGYQITFVPQGSYLYESNYTAALQRRSIECMYRPYINNLTEVLDDQQNNFEVVVVYRYYIACEVFELLRKRLQYAPIIFHTVDLHHLRERREAELKSDSHGRLKATVTQSKEFDIIARADCTIVHTPVEKQEIQSQMPAPLSTIVEFPYIAEISKTEVAYEQRHHIIFLGNFAHPPNVDAVCFFAREVWPRLMPQLPEIARFIVVGPGGQTNSQISSLASKRITVIGQVPEIKPWLDQARIFVSPLRYGAGIKGKLIQALAHGIPCVATNITVEGVNLTQGENILTANTAEQFIDTVLSLYHDKPLWTRIQSAGYKFIEDNYSWEQCLARCRCTLDVAQEAFINRTQRESKSRLRSILGVSDELTH